jgi:hypothetical protein
VFVLDVGIFADDNSTVTSSPSGISCFPICSAVYNFNQVVTLIPHPDVGHIFLGWSGDCQGTGACVLTMTRNMSVGASFGPPPPVLSITIASSRGSGRVTSNPPGIDCTFGTCSASFPAGTVITITGTPDPGSLFRGWMGGGCDNFPDSCTGTLTSNVTVTAFFEQEPR